MKKTLVCSGVAAVLALFTMPAYSAALLIAKATEVAPKSGWAGYDAGTKGGSKATSANIYQVRNKQQLVDAIKNGGDSAKIIQVIGTLDISEGAPYRSVADQKSRSQIPLTANTTLIGTDKNAKIVNGSLVVSKVNNVIIRNLYLETPVDVAPKFESGDGWNAEWDSLTISESEHVWVDHVTFSDGSFTDDQYGKKDGWKYVQHDGMLDIKKGSDYITVSHSHFNQHDKTMLIGHSDSNKSQDAGKLRVTLHNNLFEDVTQRVPRVRFGRVHAYNNLYLGDITRPVYPYLYSFGIGKEGGVLSEKNYFSVNGATDGCELVKSFTGTLFKDSGSVLNNAGMTLSGKCSFSSALPQPPYSYNPVEPGKLPNLVKANAGVGKI